MKLLFLGIAMLAGAAILGGCPIYPSQGNEYRVCDGTGCYSCPDTSYSGACISWQCASDSDCDYGYVCSDQGTCIPAPPVSPDASTGDCSVNGCPDGYICKLSNGVAQCVALGSGGDASTGDGGTHADAGGGGDSSSSGGNDASSGADTGSAGYGGSQVDSGPPPVPCNADSACGGSGAKCIDGQCTAQINLCSDGSQCAVKGSACVDGVCEVHCSAAAPCPSGYGCDFTRGVCNLAPGGCTGSGTSTCLGGAVCVDGHCAPPCADTSEGGAACVAGQVCVNGGCIPDQAATFACANDGDEGQLANACPTGSTCLHHDCYASCNPDAGATCPSNASQGCQNVTIETGTYGVCAAASTLGSDCDPAQGKYCASGVCIDGYCK